MNRAGIFTTDIFFEPAMVRDPDPKTIGNGLSHGTLILEMFNRLETPERN